MELHTILNPHNLELTQADLPTLLSSSLYLSISESLNLSLSLRYGDRADTIITLPSPHHHQQLFKDLRVDLYVILKCDISLESPQARGSKLER